MLFLNSLGTMIYILSSAMMIGGGGGGGEEEGGEGYILLISYTCSHGRLVCALYQGTACSKLVDNS